MDNKKLLCPETPLGKFMVLFFGIAWWIIINKPCLHYFNNLVERGYTLFVLGMPVNFAYVIGLSALATLFTFVTLLKWQVGEDE